MGISLKMKLSENQKKKMGKKKIDLVITHLTIIWFALQGLFMLFWYVSLYNVNLKIPEILALGCIILPSSLLIAVNNKIIRKIAKSLLWIYSIALATFGTLAVMVACPKPMLAMICLTIEAVNLILLATSFFRSYFELDVQK